MRVFSASQGKFIDTPDSPQQTGGQAFSGTQAQATAPVATGPIPGQDQMTSIGIPDSQLKNTFFQMGLANPKSISNLTSLYNFVKPTEQSATDKKAAATAQDKQKAIQKGNKSIDTIYNYWKKGVASSPINRLTATGVTLTGQTALNPSQARISAEFFANLEPELRKAAIGGRMTQQEITWLRQNLVPNATDSDESAKEKIQALKSAFGGYVAEPGQDSGSGGYKYNVVNVGQ